MSVPEMKAKLRVRLTPRSSRSQIVEWDGEVLHIKVKSPPVDGKANVELVELIADWADVPKSQVGIYSGQSSRIKTVEVNGVDQSQLTSLLEKLGTRMRNSLTMEADTSTGEQTIG